MIIKQIENKPNFSKKYVAISLVFLLVGFISYLFITRFKSDSKRLKMPYITCGAEKIVGNQFLNDGHSFEGAKLQSSDVSFEGGHSVFVDNENQYAFSTNIEEIYPKQVFEASVWVKTSHLESVFIVAKASNPELFYKQSGKVNEVKDGWNKLSMQFEIPKTKEIDKIIVYVYISNGDEGAYFDNLTIKDISEDVKVSNSYLQQFEELKLYVDPKGYDKLRTKRNEAIHRGLLVKGDDDWVKAKLSGKEISQTEVKIRLKGDWTDHLKGSDWSFRVKMPSDNAWNRMQTFSLQNPNSRGNLSEWIYHKMLEEVDVLTPKYDFIKFKINGLPSKVYAYEEHFEKHLVESRNRREGVILRLAEDDFWDYRLVDKINGTEIEQKVQNKKGNAEITPFIASKVAKTAKLKNQFEEARDLLYSYQQNTLKPKDVFNLEKLAKFYAIAEITHAFHSLIWHNMRYYYDPIIRKLEPVGFDGFAENGEFNFHKKLFFGAYMTSDFIEQRYFFEKALFTDIHFNELYSKYLFEYSNPVFINAFLEKNKNGIASRENLLQTRNENYFFDEGTFKKNAREIHTAIKPRDGVHLKAYRDDCKNATNCRIMVSNFHPLPLDIIGSGKSEKDTVLFEEPLFVFANGRWHTPEYSELEIPKDHDIVFYKVPGIDGVANTQIKNWNSPTALNQRSIEPVLLDIPLSNDKYSITDKIIKINPGNHTLNKALKIPTGYKLMIDGGTTIDLIEGAYILSYSPIDMNGMPNGPVTIKSSDITSQGIHILKPQQMSKWAYVFIDGLNTLSVNNWQLTGAVSFYETSIKMSHVTISNNKCEDALNTVRTQIDIDYLNVNHTFADGFDADFCKGDIKNSFFSHTGNDGLDFSGSDLTIKNCTFYEIGDKGISVGEQATVRLFDIDIDGAEIGIASKDLSQVTIENISIANANKGFAAFQKKPEYGPAQITVKNYQIENVDFLQIAENESTIKLEKE